MLEVFAEEILLHAWVGGGCFVVAFCLVGSLFVLFSEFLLWMPFLIVCWASRGKSEWCLLEALCYWRNVGMA